MPVVLSASGRDNSRSTASSGTRRARTPGSDAALRTEPPGDDRPRERPNGFQEHPQFTTGHRCYPWFLTGGVLPHTQRPSPDPNPDRIYCTFPQVGVEGVVVGQVATLKQWVRGSRVRAA
jgi:hypothetical protein